MANELYYSAGLPVATDEGQSPGAAENTSFTTAGLHPKVLEEVPPEEELLPAQQVLMVI